MFEFIKNIIEKKSFELKDVLYKINKMYIENYLTEEQKEELDNMARGNAKAENSYAPFQKQIDALAKRVEALENANKTGDTEVTEDFPEYIQPTGSHDSYNVGDKITYNGVKYECLIDNCVWTPITYPDAWQEIVE